MVGGLVSGFVYVYHGHLCIVAIVTYLVKELVDIVVVDFVATAAYYCLQALKITKNIKITLEIFHCNTTFTVCVLHCH